MGSVFNLKTAVSATMNNKAFLESILDDFCEDISLKINSMKKAISHNDSDTVKDLAHSLKGSSSSLGAEAICEISFEIEKLGKDGNIDQIDNMIKQLEREISRFKEHIKFIELNDV